MSPFAVIFDRRCAPIEPGVVERLAQALGQCATPLGLRIETAAGDCWALGEFLPASGRPEAREEAGGFCLGADGVDVRALERTLGLEPEANPSAGARLALGAARLGSGLWASLTGSFALALFDPAEATLFLARDPLGERTLYFAELGNLVLLADGIEVLLRFDGDISRALDISQLVRFFGFQSPRPGRTHFRKIEEVEPGTSVRFDRNGRKVSRFWTPEPDRRWPVRSDDEFQEEFRVQLDRATSGLLGSPGKSGIMLSGGLDSTTLAVVAARQAEERGERVAACSWYFDELATCDERHGIETTLALHDFEVIQVQGDGCWPLADQELFGNLPGFPEENPVRALKSALYSAARERGRTMLFNGGMVEIFFRGGNLYFRDLLRDHRWGSACRGLARQMRESGWRSAAGSVARVLRPTGRRNPERAPPTWLTETAKRWWSEEMAALPALKRGVRDVVPYLAMESRGMAIENCYSEQQGVRLASPYWTRDWVEFMLTLPAHQVYRPGITKFLAREAVRGAIPEAIRTRQTPTLLDPLFHRGIFERETKAVQDLLYGKNAVWHEFVEPSQLAGLGPDSPSALKLVLWNCLSFELWRRKHGWELE